MALIENPFTWTYFPTALALGALHALEPGHAKTLTAAYLIGVKGTKRDAILLGLAVAITHSLVVIGISLVAMWVGRESFTEEISHYLQKGSAIIVILLGAIMLVQRVLNKIHEREHHHHHHHSHLPQYVDKGIRPTIWQILTFGAAGGMIPCPASITVMLLALSIGKIASGLLAVAGFSLGLALTLVGIGLTVVLGLNQFRDSSHFSWFSTNASIISAAIVIISGIFALTI